MQYNRRQQFHMDTYRYSVIWICCDVKSWWIKGCAKMRRVLNANDTDELCLFAILVLSQSEKVSLFFFFFLLLSAQFSDHELSNFVTLLSIPVSIKRWHMKKTKKKEQKNNQKTEKKKTLEKLNFPNSSFYLKLNTNNTHISQWIIDDFFFFFLVRKSDKTKVTDICLITE